MTKPIDLTGLRVNCLTVVKVSDCRIRGMIAWDCVCVCGNSHRLLTSVLRLGKIKSCGCMTKGIIQAARSTHGMSKNPVFRGAWLRWRSMHRRCYKKWHKSYADYGGRGITVCERWHSVELFFEDMGHPPPGMTLERIDNNKGYSPDNCAWATPKHQANNRRNSHMVRAFGREQTLMQWCDELGLFYDVVHRRLNAGWLPELALTKRSRVQSNSRPLKVAA